MIADTFAAISGPRVRAHVTALRLRGMTLTEVAERAGVTRMQLTRTLERDWIDYATASRLLAIDVAGRDHEWMLDAECAKPWVSAAARDLGLDHANELFIPPVKRQKPRQWTRDVQAAAQAACGVCTVRDECLKFATQSPEAGIWGGTTAEERKAMRKDNT